MIAPFSQQYYYLPAPPKPHLRQSQLVKKVRQATNASGRTSGSRGVVMNITEQKHLSSPQEDWVFVLAITHAKQQEMSGKGTRVC